MKALTCGLLSAVDGEEMVDGVGGVDGGVVASEELSLAATFFFLRTG